LGALHFLIFVWLTTGTAVNHRLDKISRGPVEPHEQSECLFELARVILVLGERQEKLKDFIKAISSSNVFGRTNYRR
jgi:hypothetical protein